MTILLHGFWGQPSDWNSVIQKLPLGREVFAPDLYAAGELSPRFPLKDWAENFWRWVDETFQAREIELAGYSMGARLAIAAAVRNPQRVKRALFLSGNPLFEAEAAIERKAWELDWAQNFLNREWAELEQTWQDQGVFTHAPALPRRKTPEMREILGLSLENWSPRLHSFSREDVKNLPERMDFAFGALDQKYAGVAKSLQELGVKGQISVIANAGHRLIVEAPDFIVDWIEKGGRE